MRNRRKLKKVYYSYDIVMTILALLSIWRVIFDLVGLITIGRHSFLFINQTISLIFALDYTIGFSLAL